MNLKHPVSNGAVQVSRDQMLALSRPPSPYPLVIKSDILAYTPSPPLFDHLDMIRFGPSPDPPFPPCDQKWYFGVPPRAAPVPVTNILIIK